MEKLEYVASLDRSAEKLQVNNNSFVAIVLRVEYKSFDSFADSSLEIMRNRN
jgi:hypothetical protein